MGYDTSFHPIDVRFVHGRVLPIVIRGASADALVADGASGSA
jgi:hypothetical protein